MRNSTRAVMALVGGVVLTGGLTAPAVAGGGIQRIDVRDECDPVSFAHVPGGCDPEYGGDVTLDELFHEVSTRPDHVLDRRDALGWKFSSDTSIDEGDSLVVTSRGGEYHSFTEVDEFGGGCVDVLNEPFGLSTHPVCGVDDNADEVPDWFSTFVPAGETMTVSGLPKGTHHFECLIHPWMRVTVTVH